jgi:hypothetical protein
MSVRFPTHESRSSLAILKFISGPRFSFSNSLLPRDLAGRVHRTMFRCESPKSRYKFIFAVLLRRSAPNLHGRGLENRIEIKAQNMAYVAV